MPFFSISGSDFVEMFVGVGAIARARPVRAGQEGSAPAIIFIDEIDAVGRQRGAGLGGGHDEREQTLNQLLVEMDGFGTNEGVIVLAATNRADILDPALLRPGRFDRQIYRRLPRHQGPRGRSCKVHTAQQAAGRGRRPCAVARRARAGFTGADLENLINEAALLCARRKRPQVITMAELRGGGRSRSSPGPEKRSRVVTGARDRKLTAYHEAGHAGL